MKNFFQNHREKLNIENPKKNFLDNPSQNFQKSDKRTKQFLKNITVNESVSESVKLIWCCY